MRSWNKGAVVGFPHGSSATIKIIFENGFLPNDIAKIALCRICDDIGVDWVKTSTGYGFVKREDGSYSYKGATEKDLKRSPSLMNIDGENCRNRNRRVMVAIVSNV